MELLDIVIFVFFGTLFLFVYGAAFVFANLLGSGAIPFVGEPVVVRLRYAVALLLGLPVSLVGYALGLMGMRVPLSPRMGRWFRVPARRGA